MKVHVYEKLWMTGGAGIIALFLASILGGALMAGTHPGSHVETIDPRTARSDERFASPGVVLREDGGATVVLLAGMFAFTPMEIRVPANRPVTFRITSPDVVHGFQIVGTNGNTMVVPGYVSVFTTSFKPGEYLIVCNEYCGPAHHIMQGKLIAEVAP